MDEEWFGWLWCPNGIRGQMWPKFPDIRFTVEGNPRKKNSTRKLIRPGFEPGPAGWEATTLDLDHSCDQEDGIKMPDVVDILSRCSFHLFWYDFISCMTLSTFNSFLISIFLLWSRLMCPKNFIWAASNLWVPRDVISSSPTSHFPTLELSWMWHCGVVVSYLLQLF